MKIKRGLPKKIKCEVCDDDRSGLLEHHHVVPRAEGGDDNYWNVAVVCSSCHSRHHHRHGSLKIIGIYPSTEPVMGRTVIYEEDGVNAFGITEPYYTPQPKSVKYGGSKGTEQKD